MMSKLSFLLIFEALLKAHTNKLFSFGNTVINVQFHLPHLATLQTVLHFNISTYKNLPVRV